ncbi:MAG TPA: alkaline phosphatase PhoX [Rhodocyclaceae bacterium]|nr:alkaline phosphatase PhoX [Rhodocyclaceae bacterium]
MKFKRIALAVMMASSSYYLVACGGGSGGSGSTRSTGTFIDSPVKGLYYEASPSGASGTTDADGKFDYYAGDTVRFYVGGKSGTSLGSTAGDAIVGPFDLTGNTAKDWSNASTIRMLQVLQSLDADGDPSNGIDISGKTVPANCSLLDQSGCTVSAADAKGHYADSLTGQDKANYTFTAIDPSSGDAANRTNRSSANVNVDGKDHAIGFTSILRSGDQVGSDANLNVFGQIVDNQMKPVLAADGSKTISNYEDFSSLLPVGGKLFSVNHLEAIPGALYLTELSQDATTGKLTAVSTKAIDVSGIDGIWDPCAGSVSPWNTHLGSEEYEPDASIPLATNTYLRGMSPYYGGGTTIGGDANQLNAYNYGWATEIAVTDASGSLTVKKHYSMGRFAHELSYVMPDKKTVYQSDDGANVGFFMYVADTAADLTAGTLYAAKWTQASADGATDLPGASISWVKLGHASDAEVRTLITGGTTFDQIFDKQAPVSGVCAAGYTSINASHNDTYGQECLQLKTGMEKAAAFLETRRYAAYVGATTEFRKEEGITFDPEGKHLYVSYSEVDQAMESNKKNGAANTSYDVGTTNDIKALFNYCGAVYAYTVGSDSDIGSSFVVKATDPASGIAGRMTTVVDPNKVNPSTIAAYDASSPYAGSKCDITGIANPDNITFIRGRKTLVIGEDTTDGHWNDMTWAYNVGSKALTRIFTSVYGAENTSTYYYPNVNGFGYLMQVVQHPYTEAMPSGTTPNTPADLQSYFGYISLPAQ